MRERASPPKEPANALGQDGRKACDEMSQLTRIGGLERERSGRPAVSQRDPRARSRRPETNGLYEASNKTSVSTGRGPDRPALPLCGPTIVKKKHVPSLASSSRVALRQWDNITGPHQKAQLRNFFSPPHLRTEEKKISQQNPKWGKGKNSNSFFLPKRRSGSSHRSLRRLYNRALPPRLLGPFLFFSSSRRLYFSKSPPKPSQQIHHDHHATAPFARSENRLLTSLQENHFYSNRPHLGFPKKPQIPPWLMNRSPGARRVKKRPSGLDGWLPNCLKRRRPVPFRRLGCRGSGDDLVPVSRSVLCGARAGRVLGVSDRPLFFIAPRACLEV